MLTLDVIEIVLSTVRLHRAKEVWRQSLVSETTLFYVGEIQHNFGRVTLFPPSSLQLQKLNQMPWSQTNLN